MEKEKTEEPLQLEGEIWKPILGFEGLYEVSNMGRVKSLHYWGGSRVSIMKLKENERYVSLMLCKNGVRKMKLVHRLVYEAFNGSIPKFEHKGNGRGDEMLEINHKDENPLNNHLENLELVTRTQNNKYGNRIKRAATTMSKRVYQYTKDKKLVKEWESTMECKYFGGYNQGAVAACCRGERKSHLGFLWSYVQL